MLPCTRISFSLTFCLATLGSVCTSVLAETPRVFTAERKPADHRLDELRTLNGYFPFKVVSSKQQWETRAAEIRRRILVSQGLWPLPTKTELNAVVHGRVEREDYVVDRVFFESIPGHFVTGSLYRPKGKQGPFPAVLSPHGHWKDGRMYDAGEAGVKQQIEIGGEKFEVGGRHPIQARAVQLARMGCIVLSYDMTGEADAIQLAHRPQQWSHLDTAKDWGFFSVQADLRLQNMMGLQTWNSVRAIDFLLQLDDVDPTRIGVTGASGGGTQSMIVAAIDERIAAAMPCVMVSTEMQGGCTCENASLLRIDQGNIDIAAAIAPRALGLTAADDWTLRLETKGYPELRDLYTMLGVPGHLTAVFHTQFQHNYNYVNRAAMYAFFNQHFKLGHETIEERDFTPLSIDEATVWTQSHPRPSDDQIGDVHEIDLLKRMTADSDQIMHSLLPKNAAELAEFRRVVGGGWETILGRRYDQVGTVSFDVTTQTQQSGLTMDAGTLTHQEAREQIPMIDIYVPQTPLAGVMILLSDHGKSAAFRDGNVNEAVVKWTAKGYRVLVADLFGQGEFQDFGIPADSQRMWYQQTGTVGWQLYSGFTHGYNHPLFVQRTHDVLSLVKYASTLVAPPQIRMIGVGTTGGPIAIAATSQLGNHSIGQTIIDSAGFSFSSLTEHSDPMFVPGAVKYFGMDGLLALSAPHRVTVIGQPPATFVNDAYHAAGEPERFRQVERFNAIADFILDEF